MNVNEKVPSVSIVFDLNLPAHTTVCGMSSRLVQVTVCADLHGELRRLEDEVVDMHGDVFGAGLFGPQDRGRSRGKAKAEECRDCGELQTSS